VGGQFKGGLLGKFPGAFLGTHSLDLYLGEKRYETIQQANGGFRVGEER